MNRMMEIAKDILAKHLEEHKEELGKNIATINSMDSTLEEYEKALEEMTANSYLITHLSMTVAVFENKDKADAMAWLADQYHKLRAATYGLNLLTQTRAGLMGCLKGMLIFLDDEEKYKKIYCA